jgi:UDP-N-acetylmuramoyl-L-alanyl-D-glutamate--2,6-diaminopimelate ligase
MERICENPLGITVLLDYADTPDALEKLLCCVRGFVPGEGRVILLFGCGGERDRGKRAEMGRIASRLADFVVVTSDNARSEDPDRILEDILRGVDKERAYCVIKERKEAIRYAVLTARAGDVLILAGKGHEEYELRDGQRLYFSEREIVRSALEERMS